MLVTFLLKIKYVNLYRVAFLMWVLLVYRDDYLIDASSGHPHITWREKKELENKKIVSLGGKAPKKQRLPLSVARVMMKRQKERDQKMLQEDMILSRFRGSLGLGNIGS